MMKNKKMGILAVLVMLVAVTLNAVGGTYAKYISTYSMTDEARVAKWNFTDETERTVDLFESSYSNDNGVYVASSDASKVVAPGTEGSYSYSITGTAETNYKVTKNSSVLNKIAIVGNEGWDNDVIVYNPIEFSFDNGTTWVKAEKINRDADGKFLGLSFEDTVDNGVIYPANYELSVANNTAITGSIQWRWAFESGIYNDKTGNYSNDVLDTRLAQQVEELGLTMTATVGVTVEQTQDAPTLEVDGNTVVTNAPVTFTNRMSQADLDYVVNTLGIDTADYSDVVFNGRKLTGTIYKSNSAAANKWMGTSATGYYYPIVIKAPGVSKITVTTKAKTDGSEVVYEKSRLEGENQDTLGLIFGLTKEADTIKYVVEFEDGRDPQTFAIDASELNFVEVN